MVSPERGIFHCFGCGVGGDIFKFLMLKESVEFPEALETLAKRAGVVLRRKKDANKDKRERLYGANQKAAQFFHYILTEHKLGKEALEYLKKRGVDDKTIEEFNLGYAPNSWESLTKFLRKRGFSNPEMIDAGLIVASQRGGYDRFRSRIIFPLVNIKGEVAGFSGRILGEGEPKYLNTPITSVFDKSSFLFGLNLAKGEIRHKNQVILVEGMMDMVMSYQTGTKNVVATQGTALTLNQIELIKKYTDTVLLCFDKDLAGDNAERRGIEMADVASLNISVIDIKEGKDPADMVTKDPALWIKAVENAEPIYDYYLRSISSRLNLKTAEGKKKAAAELLPIWSKISDTMTREHYTQKLAALLETSEDFLRKEMDKKSTNTAQSFENVLRDDAVTKFNQKSRRELLEEYLVALLLKIPAGFTYVPNFPETVFQSDNYRSIYILLVLYLDAISFKSASFEISEFIKTVPPELINIIDRLYLIEIDVKLQSAKSWQEEVGLVVAELKKALIKASLEKLSSQIKSAQAFGKIEVLETLNRRFRDLSVKLKNM